MSTCKTTCLFGGALMAAGIASTAEAAPSFSFQDSGPVYASLAYVQADVGTDTQFAIAYAPTDLNLSVTASDAGGVVDSSTFRDSTTLRTEASWNGVGSPAFADGFFVQNFTVDADGQLLITWDYTALDTPPPDGLTLFDNATSTELFDLATDIGTPSGSTTVDVFAGVSYLIALGAGGDFSATGVQFIDVELIPAPGAAGVFAIAGLAATRRRR